MSAENSIMTFQEAQEKVATLTGQRVTKEHIESRIQEKEFLNHGLMTICVLTMVNGFKVTGVSAPADPNNYKADIGQAYAYDNAFRQLWQLEGYLLREKLSKQ